MATLSFESVTGALVLVIPAGRKTPNPDGEEDEKRTSRMIDRESSLSADSLRGACKVYIDCRELICFFMAGTYVCAAQ